MYTHYPYNESFAQTIKSMYGVFGARWLFELPRLVAECIEKWGLTELKTYPDLTYNYVLSGMQGGNTPIVLKLRYERGSVFREAKALEAFEKHGGAQLIAYDTVIGGLLMERVVPGEALTALFPHDDARATEIAAQLMQKLHQAPVPTHYLFPTLDEVIPPFIETPRVLGPFMMQAHALRKRLLASQTTKVLLHGDFHAGNILSSGANWRVIDPEGIVGDPLYDIAVYIRNPLTELIAEPQAHAIIQKRIHDFARLLSVDPQRIYDWAFLQAFTSAYWSIEDGLDASRHVAFLKLLHELYTQESL